MFVQLMTRLSTPTSPCCFIDALASVTRVPCLSARQLSSKRTSIAAGARVVASADSGSTSCPMEAADVEPLEVLSADRRVCRPERRAKLFASARLRKHAAPSPMGMVAIPEGPGPPSSEIFVVVRGRG